MNELLLNLAPNMGLGTHEESVKQWAFEVIGMGVLDSGYPQILFERVWG